MASYQVTPTTGTAESITLSAGHGLVTGDKVVYNKGSNSNTAIGGLTEGGNYFVRVTGNTVTLCDTKAHAENTLSTTGRVNLTDGSGAGHNLKKLSDSSGTAVGIGIAINIADMQNHANVGANTTVTAEGLSAQALMKDVDGDKTHKFAAKATSGASGGDTGVAGSFALNYSRANTGAGLSSSTTTLNAGDGDVTIAAENSTDARVEAKAKTGKAGDTGVGVSVGINIAVDNDTRAVIAWPLRRILGRLYDEIRAVEGHLATLERELEALAETDPVIPRLLTIPGIGHITATALVASVPHIYGFARGRRFASWLGLTPRAHSSGTRRRLGRITKAGDAYLRCLLTHGARSVLVQAQRRRRTGGSLSPLGQWALTVAARAGHNKATIAVANKLARMVWAVWRHDVPYIAAVSRRRAA